MKPLFDKLWQSPYIYRYLQSVRPAVPGEKVDIAVIEVSPLYPDPEYINLDSISGAAEQQILFGTNGPIVTIADRALDAAMAYAQSHSAIEVGGLCLGDVFRTQQDDRLVIRIEEMIRAEKTTAGASYVTFTYETWQRFLDIQTHDFPDLRLLGWYHSHPGFGIFLSSMDVFIHDNFFTTPWHVAVVVDPLEKQVGVFARHEETILPPQVFEWPQPLHTVPHLSNKNNHCVLRE